MKPDDNNIDEILSRLLPSASQEDMESDCSRIRHRLRSRAAQAQKQPASRTSRWMSRPAAAIATLAVIVAILGIVGIGTVWRQPAFAKVESSGGSLFVVVAGKAQPLSEGEALGAGTTVRSNGGAGGTLILADGSRVEMRSKSELSLERANDGVRIRLSTGGVIVNAAKQQTGHLYVQTRDVTVAVVGTVFLVNADEEGSRVAVIEGEVRVTHGKSEQSLGPGQQVTTNPQMDTPPVKDEVSWSRHKDEHVALLELATIALPPAPQRFEDISITEVAPNPRGPGPRTRIGCDGNVVIEPGRFTATGASVYYLITLAYSDWKVRWFGDCPTVSMLKVLSGEPSWVKTELFDINAVIPQGAPNYKTSQLLRGQAPELQTMIRKLLEERFNLVAHPETKQMPAYVLSLEAGAPRFRTFIATVTSPKTIVRGFEPDANGDMLSTIAFRQQTMDAVANLLTWETTRPFLDRTGITTPVDFDLLFASDNPDPFIGTKPTDPKTGQPLRYASGPSLAAAFKEHGLRLEFGNGPVEVLVIDRVELGGRAP